MPSSTVIIEHLGRRPYSEVLEKMQLFTDCRDQNSSDQIWLLEHDAVFTQGQAGKAEHVLNPGDIPVVKSDRGGQVTYHGPGQLVVYTLVDLKRKGLGVRAMVTILEKSIIEYLARIGIVANAKKSAPGVYVGGKKIAQLGLRVRKGRCFHGLSLNVCMDLQPFERINPCGYEGLEVTSIQTLLGPQSVAMEAVSIGLLEELLKGLGYTRPS
jgi:lipoyl(octanoyl) transferase